MLTYLRPLIVLAASLFPLGATAEAVGDPLKGERVFKKCASCHMVGPKARKRVGPVLNNILMATAGRIEGFKYSNALIAAGDDGLVWTAETLDAFIEAPKKFVPKTKMSFKGLKSQQDRADVIAYLAGFSEVETAAPTGDEFAVAPEVLALVGDLEYGEYLSSECTTCHQSDGANDGIPGIVGWETEDFVLAMHAYKEKHRDNQVMQMVTNRLDNDEIAALAAYFKSLDN